MSKDRALLLTMISYLKVINENENIKESNLARKKIMHGLKILFFDMNPLSQVVPGVFIIQI